MDLDSARPILFVFHVSCNVFFMGRVLPQAVKSHKNQPAMRVAEIAWTIRRIKKGVGIKRRRPTAALYSCKVSNRQEENRE